VIPRLLPQAVGRNRVHGLDLSCDGLACSQRSLGGGINCPSSAQATLATALSGPVAAWAPATVPWLAGTWREHVSLSWSCRRQELRVLRPCACDHWFSRPARQHPTRRRPGANGGDDRGSTGPRLETEACREMIRQISASRSVGFLSGDEHCE
jgi:hypothetical protein